MILPGYKFKDLGLDGGPYDEMNHPKVLWHTTEGTSVAGAERAFQPYPPHLCYDWRLRDRTQYIRLDYHSYALRGAESDDEYIIQVELVGFASQTHLWPEEAYYNIGMDVVAPLREMLGIPDQHLRFYRADEGIVLATSSSPIRLSNAALRAFSGHLGHQHAPDPDAHWDPGGFLIDKAIVYSHGVDMGYADDVLRWMQEERLNKLPIGHRLRGKNVGDALLDANGWAFEAAVIAGRLEARLLAMQTELAELGDDEINVIAAVRANQAGDPQMVAAHLAPLLLEGGLMVHLSDGQMTVLADVVNDEIDRRAQARADTPVPDPQPLEGTGDNQ